MFSPTERIRREFLLLPEKRWKVENSLASVLQWAVLEAVGPKQTVAPTNFFPGIALSVSASSCSSFDLGLWASVLHLSLFCTSVSKMCPNIIASSLYIISAYKRFHRNKYFHIIRGTVVCLCQSLFNHLDLFAEFIHWAFICYLVLSVTSVIINI